MCIDLFKCIHVYIPTFPQKNKCFNFPWRLSFISRINSWHCIAQLYSQAYDIFLRLPLVVPNTYNLGYVSVVLIIFFSFPSFSWWHDSWTSVHLTYRIFSQFSNLLLMWCRFENQKIKLQVILWLLGFSL